MNRFVVGLVAGLALAAIVVGALALFTDLRVTDQSSEQEAADLLVGNGQEVDRCCDKRPSITVPDVKGNTLAEARTTLEKDGLRVRVIRPPGPTSSNSAVINQIPSAGAVASPGLRVKLFIARG